VEKKKYKHLYLPFLSKGIYIFLTLFNGGFVACLVSGFGGIYLVSILNFDRVFRDP
jgi:hypothetical protein